MIENNQNQAQVCELVIIQPTPFCNIDCTYCYLPDRLSTKRIDVDTLRNIAKALFTSPYIGEEVRILWHAGEPLVLPVEFYERALSIIAEANNRHIKITHALQTNGTLINKQWCDFFKRHNVYVGVSLDGPEWVHNSRRVDRLGRGTFERTMKGIHLLQENEVPFAVLAVLTDQSLSIPDEVWQFFIENRLTRFGFNFEEVVGNNLQTSLRGQAAIKDCEFFFRRLLQLSDDAENRVSIREVDFTIRHIKYGTRARHLQENTPIAILNFDCEGNVSTFSPELLTAHHPTYGNFTFGNVNQCTLPEIFESEKFQLINRQIQAGVKTCKQTCDYFAICGGGRPSHKLFENGTFVSTETMTCKLDIKAMTDVVLEHLETKFIEASI